MSMTSTATRSAWAVLLAAPSVTVFAPTHAWDVQPLAALAVSLCAFTIVWLIAGRRSFFVLTYPFALFGALAMAADFGRHVDLLELLLLGNTSRHEITGALAPYWFAIAATAGLLALQAWFAARTPVAVQSVRRDRWPLAAPVAAALAAAWLCAWSPAAVARAWPMNLLTAGLAQATGRPDLLATTLPYSQIDPRQHAANWAAHRARPAPPGRETYVLVIGESVRADRLQACGGRPGVGPAAADALVFCDVMANSSSTHTSVPLLISRDSPGSPVRVSQDATFMHAFAEAGFHTAWLSVQEASIAWPDAQHTAYLPLHGTDRASLLAPLRAELRSEPERQLVVLHAYNAHFPYCERFAGTTPLVPVDCARLGALPTRASRDAWLASYDDAVRESMAFLDAVAAAADSRGGEVFVVYVPDHGENLLDDERELFQHALREPTRWDTRVPLIVHANAAWRERHPAQWEQLSANRSARVMHADVVPTLLGAAGIAYEEPRRHVADLTAVTPGPRTRWVLRRLGQTIDGDRL
jgi:glucan phosphoethanolaminetransferase (alkaline phosphatase superfamily)